jgi:hypothetical protein
MGRDRTMADRVVAMSEDAEGVHYLWDCGYVVTRRTDGSWHRTRVPHPASEMFDGWHDREAAPEVYADAD